MGLRTLQHNENYNAWTFTFSTGIKTIEPLVQVQVWFYHQIYIWKQLLNFLFKDVLEF